MLSERERQALDAIEQRIAADDPRFAALMHRLPGRAGRWTRCAHDVVVVVAALSAALCLLLSSPGPGLVALLLATVAFRCRPGEPTPRRPRWRGRRPRDR
jgi:Protein of unknown function (DUF3040)